MPAIRRKYSEHFLRATREGFKPLSLREFVALAANATTGF